MPKMKKCPVCNQSMKVENLEKHIKKVHPREKVEIEYTEKEEETLKTQKVRRRKAARPSVTWKLVAIVVASIVIIAGVLILWPRGPLQPDSQFQPFTVNDTNNNNVNLNDWDNEIIYLDFMDSASTDCETNTGNALVPLYQNYGPHIKMLSVSVREGETNPSLEKFKTDTGAQWSFAMDTAGAQELYQVSKVPTGFLINRGVIKYMHEGVNTYSKLRSEAEKLVSANKFKDFTVTDIDGNTITISNWVEAQEVVLLDFFQSTCGYCQQNANIVLTQIYDDYGSQIKMLSVSIRDLDTEQDLIDFRTNHANSRPWSFALDTANAQGLYYVTHTPTTFLIDRNGIISYSHQGLGTYYDLSVEINKVL